MGRVKDLLKRLFTPQFIRFIFTAILNTAVGIFINWVFYFIFDRLFHINHAYFISNLVATVFSILFNFKTYGALVFKNKDNRLIFRFVAITTFTYLINVGGLALLEWSSHHFGYASEYINYINLAIMAIPVGLLNYVLCKHFVYTDNAKRWHWYCLLGVLAAEVILYFVLR
ncbi:MAG: GtrA family protein [Bacteroidales bacterium]|nr:GtrA family protein [Bacteroidales bacterium]